VRFSFVGDYQLPIACQTFVEEYGPKIIKKGLYHNFILHLTNLYDFGLIRPDLIQRTIAKFIALQNTLSGGANDTKTEVNDKVAPKKYMSPWVKYLPKKLETLENDSQFDTDEDSQMCESVKEEAMESQS
jgi:polycomb protein SUZ12